MIAIGEFETFHRLVFLFIVYMLFVIWLQGSDSLTGRCRHLALANIARRERGGERDGSGV